VRRGDRNASDGNMRGGHIGNWHVRNWHVGKLRCVQVVRLVVELLSIGGFFDNLVLSDDRGGVGHIIVGVVMELKAVFLGLLVETLMQVVLLTTVTVAMGRLFLLIATILVTT
jgi:hypothetical protein